MSGTSAEGSPGGSAFIRAGGGVQMNPRRLAGILVWLTVAVLVGVAGYLAATAAQQDSRLALLRRHGVPVLATVTGCRGISSGVGMGIEYWQCRGSFVLSGHAYEEYIGGNRALLDQGTRVAAVVVPGQPELLSTAAWVRKGRSSTAEYTVAACLGAAGVALAAGRAAAVRRRRSGRPAPG